MNKMIKELYNTSGKLITSTLCNKPYNHIAIRIEDNIFAESINNYLHDINIDSSVIKNLTDNSHVYIRIYGNNDCDKFINLIG